MNQHHPDLLADHLDDLIPPGRRDLPAFDLPDPALYVARQIAGAEHPVMAEDRVSQLETQLLTHVAIQQRVMSSRRRIMRGMRWIAAACVLVVMAAALVIGVALLDESDPHIITPGTSAYESPDLSGDTVQPVSESITVRESRESSLFVVPLSP
jgi:hypothetical protein